MKTVPRKPGKPDSAFALTPSSSGATLASDIGSFVSPFHATRSRFTPGVQFLVHANIKESFEYQIRPQQIVYDPTTGKALSSPFRTNSAVAGLGFVY